MAASIDFGLTGADVLLSCASSSSRQSHMADCFEGLGSQAASISQDRLCSNRSGRTSAIPTWLSNGVLGTATSDVPSTGALPPVSELRPGTRSGSGLQLWALTAQTAYQQTVPNGTSLSSPKDINDMPGFTSQRGMPYQIDGAISKDPSITKIARQTYSTDSTFPYGEISGSDLATEDALSSLETSAEQMAAAQRVLDVADIASTFQSALDQQYSNISALSISNAQLSSEEETTLRHIVDDSQFSFAQKRNNDLLHVTQPATAVSDHSANSINARALQTPSHHARLVKSLGKPGSLVRLASSETTGKSEPPPRKVKDRAPLQTSLQNGHKAAPDQNPRYRSAGEKAAVCRDAGQTEPVKLAPSAASFVEEVRCFRCTLCAFLHETKSEVVKHVSLLHRLGADGRAEPISSGHAVVSRAEKRFLCGKCRRGFVTLDDCCRHLNQAHKAKSKKIRLEWVYTNQPDQMRAATPAEEILAEAPPQPVSRPAGNGAPESCLRKEPARPTSKKNPGRKPAASDASMSSSQKAWRRKVNREQGSFICERKGCNIRFRELENLEYHVRCHRTDATDFACPECSLVFLRWRTMTVHLWRQHLCDMELHCCDQCNFRTYSLSKLENMHKRIHGDERPFLCDVCGKGFKTSKQLRNHKAVHVQAARRATGVAVRGESCSECGRRFYQRRLLQLHRDSVHRKLRPFLCSYCGHRAANQSSLKMHLRLHTGEKPFACHLCDYRTADHNSLRRHVMRHTGTKPYKCPHCPYACIQVRVCD
ncbi:unnamed protein product [Ixodes hexagonus]